MKQTSRTVACILLTLLATGALFGAMTPQTVQAAGTYSGRVVQSEKNCGLTQVLGTVRDSAGNPQTGVNVRLWWSDGTPLQTVSGKYGQTALTDSSGWEFFLDAYPKANTWFVALEDGSGNLLSEPVAVQTTSACSGDGAANVVKVEFSSAPAAPAPVAPAPAAPPAASAPSSSLPGVEPAPAITAGALCETYSQTGGFAVCDDGNANFLSAFNSYGLQNVGYPISIRFKRDGFITQAFQKAVLQWRPDSNTVAFVNVFDELNHRGMDQTLLERRQTPFQLPAGWDGNVTFEQAVARRQALLNERPSLRNAYFSVSDPLLFFGLPTSQVTDMGNHYAIRLQRAVLQEWKEDVPWARAGEVTVANGGDIAKELGHLPTTNLVVGGDTPPVVAPPLVPAPQPVAPPDVVVVEPVQLKYWDSRLDSIGVTLQPAQNCSDGCWRLVEAHFEDYYESGQNHNLYSRLLDESGTPAVGTGVHLAWPNGDDRKVSSADWADFPIWACYFPDREKGGYSAYAGDDLARSDQVHGLGLPACQHVNFRLTWQWVK